VETVLVFVRICSYLMVFDRIKKTLLVYIQLPKLYEPVVVIV
jgi:hypothetical protein